nr:hypothetical protein GCM10020092_057150 [Actinoplanes digitatis]
MHNLVVRYCSRHGRHRRHHRTRADDLLRALRRLTGHDRRLPARPWTHSASPTPQFVALRVIWHRGRLTVRDLGDALSLDSGTLSPLLKRLETQGLIRRERGTDDERVVWITPTDQGSALRHRVADLPERLACATDLSVDEFTQLHHLLSRIRGTAVTPAN